MDTLDVLTTAVGRNTLPVTFRSFFEHARFSGSFRCVVVLDRVYDTGDERREVLEFLGQLTAFDPRIESVVVHDLQRHHGLDAALGILAGLSVSPMAVHLEDDWEFFEDVDLDELCAAMTELDLIEIGLGNTHVAANDTYSAAEPIDEERFPGLRRLPRHSWAYGYLPLCPHLHRTDRWWPLVLKALMTSDRDRCPDERVREYVLSEAPDAATGMAWALPSVCSDIGRPWASAHGVYKATQPTLAASDSHVWVPDGARRSLTFDAGQRIAGALTDKVPGGTATFQKRYQHFPSVGYPRVLHRGCGSTVWDVDGQQYVDYICALGAASLGHGHPVVVNTVKEKVERGHLFSLPHPSMRQALESVLSTLGHDEFAGRFFKTGAEAVDGAVRLARAVTGRQHVLLAGYHGHLESNGCGGPGIVDAYPAQRVGELDGDVCDELTALIERHRDDLACLVISAPHAGTIEAGQVRRLCELAHRVGALVVSDEIVTGFRLRGLGYADYVEVDADLFCYAKALAAGFPLSLVCGRAELIHAMSDLRLSTTTGDDVLSLFVSRAVQRHYQASDYYDRLERLGRQLVHGLNGAAREAGWEPPLKGFEAFPLLELPPERGDTFLAEMAARGFLLRRGVNFICGAHTEEQVQRTVEAALPSFRAAT